MHPSERELPIPEGFPDGLRVVVTGGQYDGDTGVVVDRAPDLRPFSIWVDMAHAGTHLIPGYRLTTHPDQAG